MSIEKRAFPRLAFPKDREVVATLVQVDGTNEVRAKILNVSQGGIGLAAEKSVSAALGEEIEFLLRSVSGDSGIPSLNGQKVKVKWILDYEPLNNVGVGCEFVGLQKRCIEEINALFAASN